MQFGYALDRSVREILITKPSMGPVQLLKVELGNGFYQVNLNIEDIPKLGVVFPIKPGEPQMAAFPLILSMEWKKQSPNFPDGNRNYCRLGHPSHS